MNVYLDNSATTKPYAEVTKKMVHFMEEEYGNPSSLHRLGVNAEKALKEARRMTAVSLSAMEEEIIFTSGGTESDNMAILGAAQARSRRGNHVITSKIEHPAVMESCKRLSETGFQVTYIDVDDTGRIRLDQLEEAMTEKTILITVMQVNNEVGTIQPLEEIGKLKAAWNRKTGADVLFHSDAVQGFGKLPPGLQQAQIDLLSVSGHKIHGPKGIGALYLKKGLTIPPHLLGGGQERGMRSGTENLPGIVGFGEAVAISNAKMDQRLAAMKAAKNYLQQGIEAEIPDIQINSSAEGVPSILHVSFLGVKGEVLLHQLEQAGIYVSTGSACSSNKKGQGYVLQALGLKEKQIEGAIRFSFNEFHGLDEMDDVLVQLKNAVSKFRKLGRFR